MVHNSGPWELFNFRFLFQSDSKLVNWLLAGSINSLRTWLDQRPGLDFTRSSSLSHETILVYRDTSAVAASRSSYEVPWVSLLRSEADFSWTGILISTSLPREGIYSALSPPPLPPPPCPQHQRKEPLSSRHDTRDRRDLNALGISLSIPSGLC